MLVIKVHAFFFLVNLKPISSVFMLFKPLVPKDLNYFTYSGNEIGRALNSQNIRH